MTDLGNSNENIKVNMKIRWKGDVRSDRESVFFSVVQITEDAEKRKATMRDETLLKRSKYKRRGSIGKRNEERKFMRT